MQPPTIDLYGTPLHVIGERECVRLIIDKQRAGHGGWVATHNLDHLRRLRGDPEFAALCQTASLRVADGMPLIWASRLQGGPALPERVAGSSLIYSLTEAAAAAGCSVFFLGGNEGTAEGTARILTQRYGGLQVGGFECPPVGFEEDSVYLRTLEARLVAGAPDIVYVALGSPKQERLMCRLLHALPATWFLGVGVSFSFVAGEIHRAPRWIQNLGFEWLHRLLQEPRRLGKRYLIEGMQTAASLFISCLAVQLFHPQGQESQSFSASRGSAGLLNDELSGERTMETADEIV